MEIFLACWWKVMNLEDLIALGPVYSVAIGKSPGLYSSWTECQDATCGVQYAVHANALAAIEWLEQSVHKEIPIPNAARVYIARYKNCIVLWYPETPTATKVFRCNEPYADLPLLGLMHALEHTAMHQANIYYSDSSCVKGFNYFLKENQASPLCHQIYQLASTRQFKMVLKYVPKTDPEMNYAMYVAELYWKDRN
jgi:hypothetical protein